MRLFHTIVLITGLYLLGVLHASAASITYDLTPLTLTDRIGSISGTVSLTSGYITTDGTIGTLASTDITAFSVTLSLSAGSVSSFTFTGTNPAISFTTSESELMATATQLLFDFSDSPSFLPLDLNSTPWALAYYPKCPYASGSGCVVGGDGNSSNNIFEYLPESSSNFAVAAVPGTAATPLPTTLPLLAGGLGVLSLLSWRRKRKNAAIAAV